MRTFVVVFVVFCALALATPAPAEPSKPETIEEVDLLRVQLAESQAREAQARAEALAQAAQQAVAVLRAKYKLGDSDGIDPQTRQIKRAPKPAKAGAK